jgi:membrane-bound metal-dependent hydrolase YbcI (DUF457 family)
VNWTSSFIMPLGGHHAVAFVAKAFCQELPLWLLVHHSMLTDTLAALFVLVGVERVAVDYPWLATPTEHTLRTIARWKAEGRWLEGVDLERGEEGFHGFRGAGPFYFDITYSHSLVFTLLVAAILTLLHAQFDARVRMDGVVRGRLLAWLAGVTVSHVLLDALVHDTYVLFGDRTLTRWSLNLWRRDGWKIPLLCLELLAPLGAFLYWLRCSRLADGSAAAEFRKWALAYWAFVALYEDNSWYFLGTYARLLWPAVKLGDNPAVSACILLSYLGCCYPCARMDALRVPAPRANSSAHRSYASLDDTADERQPRSAKAGPAALTATPGSARIDGGV